jgi:cytochrome c2
MEEQYAIMSKKVALVCGLVCFFVFMAMLSSVFDNKIGQSEALGCGTKSPYKSNFNSNGKGKTLFINNCAQCHNKNMKDRLTGPPLQHWRDYWADENEVFLFLSQKKLSKSRKLSTAYKKLKREYSPAICSLFHSLTKEEVIDIIHYLERQQNAVSY